MAGMAGLGEDGIEGRDDLGLSWVLFSFLLGINLRVFFSLYVRAGLIGFLCFISIDRSLLCRGSLNVGLSNCWSVFPGFDYYDQIAVYWIEASRKLGENILQRALKKTRYVYRSSMLFEAVKQYISIFQVDSACHKQPKQMSNYLIMKSMKKRLMITPYI